MTDKDEGVVRWGFLGAGNMSRVMAPLVAASHGAELRAVAARDVARARAVADAGKAPDALGSYADLIDHSDVDVVYVALANDAHLSWTLAALAAGKAVLCEKPLGRTAVEVDEMITASMESGRPLVEALWYRWHPRIRLAEKLLREGEIGDVLEVSAGFAFDGLDVGNYRWNPEHGGGALYDVGCYPLSAALWAVGRGEPDTVTAASTLSASGVDITTEARLRWNDAGAGAHGGPGAPASATIIASMAESGRQWLTVEGTLGRLEIPGNPFTDLAPDGTELHVRGRTITVEPANPYQLMIENVSSLVSGGDGWTVDLGHSHAIATTIDACFAAATAG